LINLFIFFQDNDLTGRIAAIAVLTLAYVAFIPTINEQIPQTPEIKLADIFIYFGIIATALCVIQSYVHRDDVEYTTHYDWQNDGFFIAVLIINIVTFVFEIGLLVTHFVYW
jgi:uncharacterized membrane protein